MQWNNSILACLEAKIRSLNHCRKQNQAQDYSQYEHAKPTLLASLHTDGLQIIH